MWDQDPDFRDAMEEHNFEQESDDDFSDSEHEGDPEDTTEEDLFDDYSEYLNHDH